MLNKYMVNNLSADLMDFTIDYKIWFDKKTVEGKQPLIGEKKIQLLQAIDNTGSIKSAAEKIKLDFKTAWDMTRSINDRFKPHPLVVSKRGGSGGSYLSPLGVEVVQKYLNYKMKLDTILPRISETYTGKIDEIKFDPTGIESTFKITIVLENLEDKVVKKLKMDMIKGKSILLLNQD